MSLDGCFRMRTFKYRLYPTRRQQDALRWILARCCELYNAALQERRDAYEMCVRRHPGYYDKETRRKQTRAYAITKYAQSRELTEIKHEIRPEYQEIGDHVLRNVLQRIDLAFQAFFRRVAEREKHGGTGKVGYPRFKSSRRYDSFATDSACKIRDGRLEVKGVGWVKVKLHRPLSGEIKTWTVKREGEHWYVCIVCDQAAQETPLPFNGEAVGIDLGLLHFATLSTGETIENPRYFRQAEKKLALHQQALARKKRKDKRTGCKGHRRERAVKLVVAAHRKIRNQRRDFQHKASRQLVNRYGAIVFEELQPANLSRRPKAKQAEDGHYLPNGASAKSGLNKSILDAGWGTFVQMCAYKAEGAGRALVQVDPRNTSQICSGCGEIAHKKDLSERWHACACGCSLDRDHNAAINIVRRGLASLNHADLNYPAFREAESGAFLKQDASQHTDGGGPPLRTRKGACTREGACARKGALKSSSSSHAASQLALWPGL